MGIRRFYAMEILKVQNLSKTYGAGENAVHALRDVSFTVAKGEFAAIVRGIGIRQEHAVKLHRSAGRSHLRQGISQ